MSGFGSDDPRDMPAHFFYRSLRVNYETAVRADTDKQNCSICPRHWYADAIFPCDRCGAQFAFTAAEQRAWYEDYGFWVDSLPRHCLACRQDLRNLKALRQEYDRSVAHAVRHGDLASKKRLAGVIDQLYELGGELPARINENRRQLASQIAQSEEGAA
jgi:hypothetical protein